jgi:hypothetical protein
MKSAHLSFASFFALAALFIFAPLVLPPQDLLPGPLYAAGHCECVGCELGHGMAVDRYTYDPASQDSMIAGRTAMARAHDQAVAEAHALQPLCDAPCVASNVTYSFVPPPSFFSTNKPGHGEAHARWRVTGSCKKPPEEPKHEGAVQPPNENPPNAPGGAGGATTPGGTSATAPFPGINGEIAREMKIGEGDTVEIAPMVKKGDSTPGEFVPVPAGDPFGGLLGLPGITPGTTDPETLKGKPGVLDIIKKGQSQVINKDGARATMGYFIRVKHKDGTVETFFILMSYDLIILADGKPLAAFEVFKFGPITDPDAQPALLAGLAVDKNGNLLPAVPLGLAKVKNFDGQSPDDKPVTPGVNQPNQGCLECHSQTDDFPSDTLPFPWIAKPKKAENKTEDFGAGSLLKHFHVGIGVGVGGESGGGHHGQEGHGGNESGGQHNNTPPPEPQNNTPPPNEVPNNQPPPGNR